MKKELLNIDEKKIGLIEGSFMLDTLQLKNAFYWLAKLKVKQILPKSYHEYNVKMIFNEAPYLERISRFEEKLNLGKQNRKLFKKMEQEDIDDVKDQIKDEQRDMAEKKRQCPTIDFSGKVEQIKYAGAETVMTMNIPDSAIDPLNKSKTMFQYYKIQLSPIL